MIFVIKVLTKKVCSSNINEATNNLKTVPCKRLLSSLTLYKPFILRMFRRPKSTVMNVEKSFQSKRSLNLHSQFHTGKFAHYCGQCRRGFSQRSHYKEHMRKHEGRGYPCEYCPKLFSNSKSLRYHMSEHTGKYRFTCDYCFKNLTFKVSISST